MTALICLSAVGPSWLNFNMTENDRAPPERDPARMVSSLDFRALGGIPERRTKALRLAERASQLPTRDSSELAIHGPLVPYPHCPALCRAGRARDRRRRSSRPGLRGDQRARWGE